MEELDIIRNYLEDVYYEFGEDSDFFKENFEKFSQRQKDLLKRLFDFRRSYFESLESKDIRESLVELKSKISDLEVIIEEMKEKISNMEN